MISLARSSMTPVDRRDQVHLWKAFLFAEFTDVMIKMGSLQSESKVSRFLIHVFYGYRHLHGELILQNFRQFCVIFCISEKKVQK